MAKEKRKPDYDEKEIPKVLKGPVKAEPKPIAGQPLRARPDYGEDPVGPPQDAAMMKDIPLQDISKKMPAGKPDYDMAGAPPCGCHPPKAEGPGAVGEEVCMPGGPDDEGGFVTILVCPDCGNEGPFNMAPPAGIPMEARKLKCAKCKTVIPFKGLVKTASGKYMLAGSGSIESLVDRIRGIVKQGTIITWDLAQDVNTTLDRICELTKRSKKDKD